MAWNTLGVANDTPKALSKGQRAISIWRGSKALGNTEVSKYIIITKWMAADDCPFPACWLRHAVCTHTRSGCHAGRHRGSGGSHADRSSADADGFPDAHSHAQPHAHRDAHAQPHADTDAHAHGPAPRAARIGVAQSIGRQLCRVDSGLFKPAG